ncbi:AAA family ATPase [Brachybacterium sp. MASK1Z-5]|uniref:AAA family ATPase n=1 Tax=Brachybacterium halotolerans TaxID=2795215 RepID=A0ABS1BA60_9MICO|nr:AAA family ATPase [Brachybacterium halotolerans]
MAGEGAADGARAAGAGSADADSSADDRLLLLIAGYPGTGKSRIAELVQEHLGPFRSVSIDDLKEQLYDQEGFADADAKGHLDRAALELFFARVHAAMANGVRVLAEYPFSDKQKEVLAATCRRYGYRAVTVRLVADFEVLFERQRRRDQDPTRHLGHLVDAYEPGDTLADRRAAPQLLSVEVFLGRYLHRGYGEFALGDLVEIDTTDFAQVDDADVLARIGAVVRRVGGDGGEPATGATTATDATGPTDGADSQNAPSQNGTRTTSERTDHTP